MFRHPVFALSIRIVLLAGLSVAVALRLEELGMGSAFPEVHLAGMAAVIALAPLNLSAEAMKWKTLMRNDAFGYRRALAGVLNGMCTGFFTPNRVGEVVGRAVDAQQLDRPRNGFAFDQHRSQHGALHIDGLRRDASRTLFHGGIRRPPLQRARHLLNRIPLAAQVGVDT